MPLEAGFIADCPYGPGGLLIDEVVEIDIEKSMVRVRMPVHPGLPLTREQRNHPVFHPPHLSGGLMVHMTGMVGFVHAYYVFGLRHAYQTALWTKVLPLRSGRSAIPVGTRARRRGGRDDRDPDRRHRAPGARGSERWWRRARAARTAARS